MNDRKQALEALSSAATSGTWSYRPLKYDDWGCIRGGRLDDDEIGACWPIVAQAKPLWKDYDFDAHRAEKTDPCEANGRFIVELVNAYRDGLIVTSETPDTPKGETP